jgi:two-component system, OmpR family, heavy metal sensor histidine kinase CusS
MKSFPIWLRLTAWYSLILAEILSVFGVTAYLAMRNSIHETVDEDLQEQTQGIQRLMERTLSSGGEEDLQDELREHSVLRPGGALLQVSDSRGNWLYRSAAMSRYNIPTPGEASAAPSTLVFENIPLRLRNTKIQVGGQTFFIQIATPLDDFYQALHRFALLLLISIPLLLLAAVAAGFWMSRRALAPVDQITQMAKSMSVQSLSSRLAVPRTRDELQRLSETLNGMLERLEAAFKKITQFTADASHELRTPIAVMRTRTELALRKHRTADEYRDALAQLHSELEGTSDLVEKLMLLARADYGSESMHLCDADLNEIVRDVCRQGRTLSEAKKVSFRERIPEISVRIKADAHALRRLLLILIDNAVKYTSPDGQVEVSVEKQNGSALAVIRDTGIGIAAEDLPNIFERFYRADKARSRESGGVGLGLSIGRWIAEAHGGSIQVESTPGGGSTFKVQLPLAGN